MKNPIEKLIITGWEKEWDRVFKSMLKETAVSIGDGKKRYTFNVYAKQEIKGLLMEQAIEVNNVYAKSVMIAESLKAQIKEMNKTFERLDYQIKCAKKTIDTAEKITEKL